MRCCAILFVIGSHFFLNTKFNDTPITNPSLWIQGMLQSLTLINVPLFLLLTGYLNINKTVSRKYYKGAARVILTYLFFSVVTILVRKYALHENDISWTGWLLKITDFSAISYGWYVEMWIGLFLLTPFLNILWKNIGTRRHKHILIITLYILTALPDFFNRYGVHIVPGYWEAIYPVTFFYIGAYIREYQPSFNRWKIVGIIAALCCINAFISAVIFHGRPLLHLIGDGNGIIGVPMAAMFFILCYKLRFTFGNSLLASISRLSLDMYLVSYIFDRLYYPFFKQHIVADQTEFGYWYLVIVSAVFISSYFASYIKTAVFKSLHIPT